MNAQPLGQRPEDDEVVPWHGHVILDTDGRTPVRVSFNRWLQWMLEHVESPALGEKSIREVGLDEVGESEVSTCFIYHDLNPIFYGRDLSVADAPPPLCFETMVFGGALDQEQERYYTWEEAEAGHQQMLERVRIAEAVDNQVAQILGGEPQ